MYRRNPGTWRLLTKEQNIGRKIARLRKLKDWTQEEPGQNLDVHKTVISRWELGRMAPRRETLQKLAEVLGIELSELADQDRAVLPNGEAACCTATLKLLQKKTNGRSVRLWTRC